MKRKYMKIGLILFVLATLSFLTCKSSDLRTKQLKKSGITEENVKKGKQILEKALETMNYSSFAKYQTYEIIGSDQWQKQMGMNLSPWPGDNGALLRFKLANNTFDSQVEWLDAKQKGHVLGIQSWQLYQKSKSTGQFEKIKADKKIQFILPTMHYFNELLPRLSKAPIVIYAGEKEEDGNVYEMVFATWDTPEPNRHDQYLLYINKANGRLEKTSYTIRDNYMFTPKSFYGTAVYSDFRTVDSIILPFQMDVYPFGQTKKKKVHSYKIQEWRLGTFPLKELYPFEDLKVMGDSK